MVPHFNGRLNTSVLHLMSQSAFPSIIPSMSICTPLHSCQAYAAHTSGIHHILWGSMFQRHSSQNKMYVSSKLQISYVCMFYTFLQYTSYHVPVKRILAGGG